MTKPSRLVQRRLGHGRQVRGLTVGITLVSACRFALLVSGFVEEIDWGPARSLLLAPDDLAGSHPEVRSASFAQPDRRMQGHVPAPIDGNVPAQFHLLQQHHLHPLPAAARATQADSPIFVAVTGQDEIPARQLGGNMSPSPAGRPSAFSVS